MYYLNIKTLGTSIFSDTVELGENYFMNNSKDTEQRVVDFLDNLATVSYTHLTLPTILLV